MLNTWRLQLLVHLYNLKTIKAVAKATHISSPAVSTQLKILENETNTALIKKHGRNLQLTIAGIQLVNKVQPILNQLEQINNNFQYHTNVVHGNVRIVGFASALQSIIIPATAYLKENYPNINIMFTEKDSEEGLLAINSNQVDLAIINQFQFNGFDDQSNNDEWLQLGSDNLKALINVKNKLSHLNTINGARMKNINWLLGFSDNQVVNYLKNLCNNSVNSNITGKVTDHSVLNNAVNNDLAIGLLPELAINSIPNNVKVVDFMPNISRYIYLVNRKPSFLIPAINIVANAIQLQAQQIFNNRQPKIES